MNQPITTLSSDDRRALIRIGLQQPVVLAKRLNTPTGAAAIDNAIAALERSMQEQPEDLLLTAAYAALREEYPLHFSTENKIDGVLKLGDLNKPNSYLALYEWSH